MMDSELIRVATNKSRFEYYANISFRINDRIVDADMKYDTGSAFTVFSLKEKKLKPYSDYILNHAKRIRDGAETASGQRLDIYSLVVSEFKLTADIMIPKYLVYFSPDLSKSLLGLDTISLFQHKYKFEKKQLLGSYWFLDFDYTIQRCAASVKNIGYLDSRQIMVLTENSPAVRELSLN